MEAEGHGAGAYWLDPVADSGGTAPTVHGPTPRSYDYAFPRKKLLGALRSALASKFADGKLTVVNSFELKDAKTKAFRAALDALKVEKTVLIVEAPNAANRNLELSSRNIDGLELMAGNEVHPYDLLRYDRVIFSQPALEKLQLTLQNTVPKRQRKAAKEEGAKKASAAPRKRTRHEKAAEVAKVMRSAYQIIRRPVITEKGLAIKENQNTLVFQVAPKATKTEIKQAVQTIFKVKVFSVRTATYPGKERRRGKFAGYRADWKKAYVRLRAGEKMPEYAQNL